MPTAQEVVDSTDNIDDLTEELEVELEASDEDEGTDESVVKAAETNPNVEDQMQGSSATVEERWRAIVEADPELKDYQSQSVAKRIKKMTFQIRENERQKDAAIEYAEGALKENRELKSRGHTQQGNVINEHVGRVEASLANAKTKYEDAFAAQDASGMADANADIAKFSTQLANAQQHQTRYKKAPPPEVDVTPVTERIRSIEPAPPAVEPKAEAWAERNSWFGEDEELTKAALAIHQNLVTSEGYLSSSDSYYEELDNRMRKNFPNRQQFRSQGTTVDTTAPTNTVAPVNGQSPVGSRRNPTKMKLTPSQVQIAKRLGVTLQDYARQVQALTRE